MMDGGEKVEIVGKNNFSKRFRCEGEQKMGQQMGPRVEGSRIFICASVAF